MSINIGLILKVKDEHMFLPGHPLQQYTLDSTTKGPMEFQMEIWTGITDWLHSLLKENPCHRYITHLILNG